MRAISDMLCSPCSLCTLLGLKHLRNFLVEFRGRPSRGRRMGFEELSPNKTADELFGHLQRGEKIAITTRFGKHAQPYVSALERRGLKVRVISNQSDIEDFCFLMSAKKELVGTYKSTYVKWAALLGDMKRAELYDLRYPEREKRNCDFSGLNFTDQRLRNRIVVKQYNSEAQDELEARA